MPISFFTPVGIANQFNITLEADEDVVAGQVLRVLATTHLCLAQADTLTHSVVAGLAIADTVAGHAVPCAIDGLLNITDWTAITGSALLTPGATFYLDPLAAGSITSTAPTAVGQCVIQVGIALDTLTLHIDIQFICGL